MSRDDLTLGAVPARLQVREERVITQAEAARGKIAELTALLGELDTVPGAGPADPGQATEGIRAKLKRLVDRGILAETEPGLFTQPRP